MSVLLLLLYTHTTHKTHIHKHSNSLPTIWQYSEVFWLGGQKVVFFSLYTHSAENTHTNTNTAICCQPYGNILRCFGLGDRRFFFSYYIHTHNVQNTHSKLLPTIWQYSEVLHGIGSMVTVITTGGGLQPGHLASHKPFHKLRNRGEI